MERSRSYTGLSLSLGSSPIGNGTFNDMFTMGSLQDLNPYSLSELGPLEENPSTTLCARSSSLASLTNGRTLRSDSYIDPMMQGEIDRIGAGQRRNGGRESLLFSNPSDHELPVVQSPMFTSPFSEFQFNADQQPTSQLSRQFSINSSKRTSATSDKSYGLLDSELDFFVASQSTDR